MHAAVVSKCCSYSVNKNSLFTVQFFETPFLLFNFRMLTFCISPSDVINIFGVETILLYTAVLLKKKIVFYSPRIETLLNVTRYGIDYFFI